MCFFRGDGVTRDHDHQSKGSSIAGPLMSQVSVSSGEKSQSPRRLECVSWRGGGGAGRAALYIKGKGVCSASTPSSV